MSTSMLSSAKLQDDMNSIPLADDDPQGSSSFKIFILHMFKYSLTFTNYLNFHLYFLITIVFYFLKL